MGRDDKKGKSNNTSSLPQTPKNQKISPDKVEAEMAREFAELNKNKPSHKK